MPRRLQFSLKAMFLLMAVAAIYLLIAFKVREDSSPSITPSDQRFLARERARIEREQHSASGKE
jgi:hypothetical protein